MSSYIDSEPGDWEAQLDKFVVSYGVLHDGWMISFDDWKEANAFAATHNTHVRRLVSAKHLPAILAAERAAELQMTTKQEDAAQTESESVAVGAAPEGKTP